MGFFLLLVVGVGIFWAIRAARNHSRRVREAWSSAASQLGLEFDPGSLTRRKSLNGLINGNRVEVETFTRNSGSKSSHSVTRYRVRYPQQLASGLQIKPRGLLSNAAAFLGAQNIETGDAGFDSRVVVKGDFPSRVAGFLTPARRREVLRILDDFKGVKIDHQNIEWTKSGVTRNPAEIVEIVRELSAAATALSGDSTGGTPVAKAAVPLAAAAVASVFMNPSDAKPISVEPPARLRGREVPAQAATLREPLAAPAASETPTSLAEATDAGAELAVAEICSQLFTRSITSTEAKKLFEERYKGRRVRWSGNLRRAATYSIDLVFKGGPGTKATFALPVASQGALGGTVQAVVQLSPAAAEQLKKRVGDEIAFEGKLLSFDSMVRNFNIADATLT